MMYTRHSVYTGSWFMTITDSHTKWYMFNTPPRYERGIIVHVKDEINQPPFSVILPK